MSVRVTLDFETESGMDEVLQWVLFALREEPQRYTVLREVHASSEG